MGDRLGRGRAYTSGGGAGSRKLAQPDAQTAAPAAAPATPPAGTAQDAAKPDAAQPAIVPGTVGHMIPTPGIGEPDGRKGIQMQVTPIGEEAAAFHNNWLLPLCAIISVIVLGLLLVRDGPLPPRRQPDAVAQLAQHARSR